MFVVECRQLADHHPVDSSAVWERAKRLPALSAVALWAMVHSAFRQLPEAVAEERQGAGRSPRRTRQTMQATSCTPHPAHGGI